MALLVIITGIVVQITDQTGRIWRNSTAKIQAFQDARAAFEAMTRNLSQATLNTYYDYYDSTGNRRTPSNAGTFTPDTYSRYSDLHFITGQANAFALTGSNGAIVTQTHAVFFQAPLGYSVSYPQLNTSLNACGYFLQFGDAANTIPDHVRSAPGYQPRYRFRLMEMSQQSETLAVYDPAAQSPGRWNQWFLDNSEANSRVIAENVIALVLLPKLSTREDDPSKAGKGVSIAPNYNYNSRIPYKANSDPSMLSASPAFPGDRFQTYPSSGATVNASRHSQLPPMIQAVMVVIDEASAQRIQGSSTSVPSAIDLSKTTLFTDATQLAEDIRAVEDICNAAPGNKTGNTQPLTYRVFTTGIIMREAKWSNK